MSDPYNGQVYERLLPAGDGLSLPMPLAKSFGWYDFIVTTVNDSSFRAHLADHLETGRDSTTDPAIGTAAG